MYYLAVTNDREIASRANVACDGQARAHFRAVVEDLKASHTDRAMNPNEWERDVARWQAWEMDGRRVVAAEVFAEECLTCADLSALRRVRETVVLAWHAAEGDERERLGALRREVDETLWPEEQPAAQGVTL